MNKIVKPNQRLLADLHESESKIQLLECFREEYSERTFFETWLQTYWFCKYFVLWFLPLLSGLGACCFFYMIFSFVGVSALSWGLAILCSFMIAGLQYTVLPIAYRNLLKGSLFRSLPLLVVSLSISLSSVYSSVKGLSMFVSNGLETAIFLVSLVNELSMLGVFYFVENYKYKSLYELALINTIPLSVTEKRAKLMLQVPKVSNEGINDVGEGEINEGVNESNCTNCNKRYRKKSQRHKFCSSSCRVSYFNKQKNNS